MPCRWNLNGDFLSFKKGFGLLPGSCVVEHVKLITSLEEHPVPSWIMSGYDLILWKSLQEFPERLVELNADLRLSKLIRGLRKRRRTYSIIRCPEKIISGVHHPRS